MLARRGQTTRYSATQHLTTRHCGTRHFASGSSDRGQIDSQSVDRSNPSAHQRPNCSSQPRPEGSKPCACPRDDGGFTLIEVIVALTIFAVFIAFAGQATVSLLAAVQEHDARSKASGLLASSIAEAQAVPVSTLTIGTETFDRTIQNHTFTVSRTIGNVTNTTSTASLCKGDSFAVDNRSISVTVSWPSAKGPRSIQGASWAQQLTALKPSASTSATTGNAAIQLNDETGAPLPGATVTISPGGQVVSSDQNGCIVLPQLPAGEFGTNYELAITKPGYVSQTNRSTVTTTVAITRGNTVKASPVVLGQGITVRMKGSFDGNTGWDSTPGVGGLVYVSTPAEPRPKQLPICSSVAAGTPCATGFTGELRNIYPGSSTVSGDRCPVTRPEMNYPTVNDVTPQSTEVLTTAMRVRVRLRPDGLGRMPDGNDTSVVRAWFTCIGQGTFFIDYPTNGAQEVTIALPLSAGLIWTWPLEWRANDKVVSYPWAVTGSNSNRDLNATLRKRLIV